MKENVEKMKEKRQVSLRPYHYGHLRDSKYQWHVLSGSFLFINKKLITNSN